MKYLSNQRGTSGARNFPGVQSDFQMTGQFLSRSRKCNWGNLDHESWYGRRGREHGLFDTVEAVGKDAWTCGTRGTDRLQIQELEGQISTLNRQAIDAVSINQATPPPAACTQSLSIGRVDLAPERLCLRAPWLWGQLRLCSLSRQLPLALCCAQVYTFHSSIPRPRCLCPLILQTTYLMTPKHNSLSLSRRQESFVTYRTFNIDLAT